MRYQERSAKQHVETSTHLHQQMHRNHWTMARAVACEQVEVPLVPFLDEIQPDDLDKCSYELCPGGDKSAGVDPEELFIHRQMKRAFREEQAAKLDQVAMGETDPE